MKQIVTIKKSDIERISIVIADGRTMKQVKESVGCDYIINGGLYDMTTRNPVSNLKVEGKVLASEQWGAWGYAWNRGDDIEMKSIPSDVGGLANYITCVALLTPWDGINANLKYQTALGGNRGRTAIALTDDSLILYCSKDGTSDARTPEMLRKELYDMGAKTALMLDSGGSSQCDFGGGQSIQSSRKVHNYICVWRKKDSDKEENKVSDKKLTVCLDPGHGPGTVNGSPDGIYKETEFAWDMHLRIKALLDASGVNVIVTRKENVKPSLIARAEVSNKANADLFVSLHSNAYGSSGWTSPSGLLIYTSQAGDTADRNKAAKAILNRMEEAGVSLHGGGLAHNFYTVLTNTNAPAVLIEFGFHTNKDDTEKLKDNTYRGELAKATAKGICDYLSIAYKEEDMEEGIDEPSDWHKESWEKAYKAGILDGTMPKEPLTREMFATVLDRLGLI